MEAYDREKALEFTKVYMTPDGHADGYDTQIMGVLKPELLEFGDVFDRFRYPIQPWQRNSHRGLQGGMLASMIDNSIGITLIPRWGSVVSIDLNISYLAPIGPGADHVDIVTTAVKVGGAVIYVHSEVFLPDGTKAADAVSNLMRIRPQL